MAVLKYYDGTDWEPVASALQGPTGPTGATGATGAIGNTGATGPNPGLTLVIASSVTKGASGSASVDSKGNVTFSGTESISLNGVFSSTYDNYRLILNITTSTSIDLGIRFKTASDDTGSTNQARTLVWGNDGGFSGTAAVNATGLIFGWGQNTKEGNYSIDIGNPNLAKNTNITGHAMVGYSTTTNMITSLIGGQQQTATQYTGLTIYQYAGSGTMTGTARIYGYNQ